MIEPDILIIRRRYGAVHVVTETPLMVEVIDQRLGTTAGVDDVASINFPGAIETYRRGCMSDAERRNQETRKIASKRRFELPLGGRDDLDFIDDERPWWRNVWLP